MKITPREMVSPIAQGAVFGLLIADCNHTGTIFLNRLTIRIKDRAEVGP